MFDYRYVQAFLKVAELGSISKAADDLNIAQSAVSRQIALFEASLKEDLFFRGTRGIHLTPRGQVLFQKLCETDLWVKAGFLGESPSLRIGGLEGVIKIWLGEKLAKASKDTLPQVLSLAIMGNDEVESALNERSIDIGLSSRKIESEWVSSRKLYSEKICIISKNEIDLRKLDQYCWIGISKADYLRRLAKGKKPSHFIQTGSLDLLLKLVRSGHGVAALAENLAPSAGIRLYSTNLVEEAIYLNLPAYSQLPVHIRNFVEQFLS